MKSIKAIGQQLTAFSKEKMRVFGVLLAFCCVFFLSGCTEQERMFKESRILMDTYCSITVVSSSREEAGRAIEAGFDEIKRLEMLLNYFSDDSEISVLNKSAGVIPVSVSPETLEIVKKTLLVSDKTAGAFDASVAPVIRLWDFSRDSGTAVVPASNRIAAALNHVNFRNVVIQDDRSEIFLREKGMELDLGGIAKGFGADKALKAIHGKGIRDALVAIAGDIRGSGRNLSGTGWKVGIQNPRPAADLEKPWEDIMAVLHLEDSAISTSGDYQRFFIRGGKRYHHIIDPDTGFPAETDLISASVIAPEGYLSDSLSTAVFVVGAERGLKMLQEMNLEGVLIDVNKKVYVTRKITGKIEILNPEYVLADQG